MLLLKPLAKKWLLNKQSLNLELRALAKAGALFISPLEFRLQIFLPTFEPTFLMRKDRLAPC